LGAAAVGATVGALVGATVGATVGTAGAVVLVGATAAGLVGSAGLVVAVGAAAGLVGATVGVGWLQAASAPASAVSAEAFRKLRLVNFSDIFCSSWESQNIHRRLERHGQNPLDNSKNATTY
jgi:hypothetical protein